MGRGAREVPAEIEVGLVIGLKRNHEESRSGESEIQMCNAYKLR